MPGVVANQVINSVPIEKDVITAINTGVYGGKVSIPTFQKCDLKLHYNENILIV